MTFLNRLDGAEHARWKSSVSAGRRPVAASARKPFLCEVVDRVVADQALDARPERGTAVHGGAGVSGQRKRLSCERIGGVG